MLVLIAVGVVAWRVSAAAAPGQGVEIVNPQSNGAASPAANASPSAGAGSAASGKRSGPSSVATASSATTGTPGGLTVHVIGQVKRPGLYTLTSGSRIADAIKAAGGASEAADTQAINLAAPIQDGSQIRVPKRGEAEAAQPGADGAGAGGAGQSPGTGGVSGSGPAGSSPVRINAATAAELESLPGIGPARASRLIEFRESNGPFRSQADLDAVSGIGPSMLEKLQGLISFD